MLKSIAQSVENENKFQVDAVKQNKDYYPKFLVQVGNNIYIQFGEEI